MRRKLVRDWFNTSASRLCIAATALFAGAAGAFGAATVQSFSGNGGTPFITETLGGAPAPVISGGKAILISDLGGQRNNISFTDTGIKSEGGNGVISITFDYWMPSEAGHTGCCGERADGFGFGLFETSVYGSSGPLLWGWGAVEQDSRTNALTVGFDIFTGAGADGNAADNTIWLGLNGINISNRVFGPAFKLNNGLTNRVQITVATNGTDMTIDMSITPENQSSVAVFSGLVVPGGFIPNSRPIFAGRTGGAFTRVDLDNIQIYSGLTPGAVTITSEPASVAVVETQPSSFTVGVDGTAPFTIQWFSNNVAIPGANDLTYSTGPTTTNMNGTVFRADITNSIGFASSANATLTVGPAIVVQSVSSGGRTNEVRVRFNKPAALTGNYSINNGVTVNGASYGASQDEVVLSTSMLLADTSYTVTIAGETGQDASTLLPDPTVVPFFQGFGTFTCTDFSVLPPGTTLFSNATVAAYLGSDGTGNNVLHLTDDAVTGSYGNFYISNRTAGARLNVMRARWRSRIGGPLFAHADGFSFNWADNVPADGVARGTEEGEGNGVSFTIDSWDNGAGPDTGIEIKWQGARIAFQHIPREGAGNILTKDVFVNAEASVDANGRATFTYDGNTISAVIPSWNGIVNGKMNMSARTGGEADNYWVDDLCINNFTLGPVFFLTEPVETTALEGQAATFTASVDGTPSYYYQWFTNGTPVPGANSATFTIANTTEAHDGLQVSVQASNLFSSVTSSNAVLHVDISPRIASIGSVGDNTVHVRWTRPVDLNSGNYNFDNGIFENLRDYGSNQNVVVILTDPLQPGLTYTLTVDGVTEEGNPSNDQFPNPAMASFRHGYGPFCANFESGVPPGTTVTGSATVSGGVLHVTDAINSQAGSFFVPDANAGFPVDRLVLKTRTLIGSPTPNTRIADGFSINFGPDVSSAVNGEEGASAQGLIISFDTWDNSSADNVTLDNAPAIEIKYKNTVLATQSMAGVRAFTAAKTPFILDKNGNALSMDTSNAFVNLLLMVSPDGKLDLYFKDLPIFRNLQLPNYTPFVGAKLNISGRTGGASENAWFDDMCINAFSLGAVTVVGEPADATATENPSQRAQFTVALDGLPPYTVQWYSNGIAIPGATALTYITPPLNRTADGAGYHAAVSNSLGFSMSRTAIVDVIPDATAPTITSVVADCGTNIYVFFSETIDAATAGNPLNYTVTGGYTVTAATMDPSGRYAIITVNPPINPNDCIIVTVNGVTDRSPFPNPVVGATGMVFAQAPIQGSGPNNLVVIEAEDWDLVRSFGPSTPNSSWVKASTLPGFVGTGYADATPNIGAGGGDTPATYTNSSRIDYCVNFPAAGTYYIWARGSTANDGGNNSFHLGINGVSPDEFSRRIGNRTNNWGANPGNVNDFGWVRDVNGTGATSVASIVVSNAGVNTVNVWMREDGIKIDRILMTTDPTFTLSVTELGPPASVRPPTRNLSIVKNPDNSATISWPGSGWVLQATTNFPAPSTPIFWQSTPFTSPLVIPPGVVNSNLFFRLICP